MIVDIKGVTRALGERPGTWAWVGQRCVDAYTVSGFVPLDAVFCCDSGIDFERDFQGRLFSAEKSLGYRDNWGNLHLETLWEGPGRTRVEDYVADHGPIRTVCYRSLRMLEADPRFNVLAPELRLKDFFDDKIRQLELLDGLGIPVTRGAGACVNAGRLSFGEMVKRFGFPFVMQAPVGSSGENTFIVRSEAAFEEAVESLRRCPALKVSTYTPLPSLNGHCVVFRRSGRVRALAACPSVQVVGCGMLTDRTEVYCGNDFTAAGRLPPPVLNRTCDIMEQVGLAMGNAGFFGIFGMDFLLDGDEVYALEINPRFQGSTQLLSVLQQDRGEIPMAALHALQFLGMMDRVDPDVLVELGRAYRRPYRGAHMIVHAPGQRAHQAGVSMNAGIYTAGPKGLSWLKEGRTAGDVDAEGEWCVLGNLVPEGMLVRPGSRLAMAQTRGAVLAGDLMRLNADASTFAALVLERFESEQAFGGMDEPAELGTRRHLSPRTGSLQAWT